MHVFVIYFESADNQTTIVGTYTTAFRAWTAFRKAAKSYFEADGALLVDNFLYLTPWGYWINQDNATLYCETVTLDE